MDHADVLEQLDLAAVEPGGLERLMAGDTAAAAAVVGHLAGCATCTGEFQRLSRAVPLLRDSILTTPPADLRERTLAFVRIHGEPRAMAATAGTVSLTAPPDAIAMVVDTPRPRFRRVFPWVATAAAAVALAVAGATLMTQRETADRFAGQAQVVAALEAVNEATLEITGGPDAERVALISSTGGPTSGTLLFSPSTTRLVVVATELERPPSGQEYRCWVEVDGRREDVGRMFFADEVALWVGDTPEISDVPKGTTFGVSLTEIGGTSLEADPVIVGAL